MKTYSYIVTTEKLKKETFEKGLKGGLKMAGKISDLFFEIGYKVNPDGYLKAEQGMEKLGKKAQKSGTNVLGLSKSLGGIATKVSGVLSVGYAMAKLTQATVIAVNTQADLDDKLRTVVSKLGANEHQLKELAPTTKQVAREYHVLAGSVAEAQDYLALAGYSLEEIKSGTPAVVAAQRATGESMKLVSDIATDTASAYAYTAEGLEYITDRMVYTTTKFNTNFVQMGEAMKYVAPIAKQAGMEFEDLSAYIGTVANSGIKGSQAGTSLRMAFLRLQAPTKEAQRQLKRYNVQLYDNKGNFIGINKAMLNIEKATKRMTDKQRAMFMQQIFGTESMSAMNIVFKEGIQTIIDYGEAIGTADGQTQRMAEFMEQGIGGLKRGIQSEKEAIALTLGEALEPAAVSFLQTIKEGMQDINKTLEKNKEGISNFGLAMSATNKYVLKPALKTLGWFTLETANFLGEISGINVAIRQTAAYEREQLRKQKEENEQNLITEQNISMAKVGLKNSLGLNSVESINTETMMLNSDILIDYLKKESLKNTVKGVGNLGYLNSLGDIYANREMKKMADYLSGGFVNNNFFKEFERANEQRIIDADISVIKLDQAKEISDFLTVLSEKYPEADLSYDNLNNIALPEITAPEFEIPKVILPDISNTERKIVEISLNINGLDTLGNNVADIVSEHVQSTFDEAMNYQLSNANLGFGGGFGYK